MKEIDFAREPEFTERLPEVFLTWLKPLHETITYNSQLVDALAIEIDSRPETLSRWIYVGRHNLRDNERMAFRNKMLDDGWGLLSEQVCQQAIDNGNKLILRGKVSADWLSQEILGKFRVRKCAGSVRPFYLLIPPRRRTRGYTLGTLTESGHQDCFYKVA